MSTPIILEHWQHEVIDSRQHLVLPDGCRDVIIKTSVSGQRTIFLSSLAEKIEEVPCHAGDSFEGFRLAPGSIIHEQLLLSELSRLIIAGEINLRPSSIEKYIDVNSDLSSALLLLAKGEKISRTCRLLGISERSLERLTKKFTGRPPTFWRSLARARRAARLLISKAQPSFTEVALDCGYSDQAHMCRDFKKWFHYTPQAFLQKDELTKQISSPAYS